VLSHKRYRDTEQTAFEKLRFRACPKRPRLRFSSIPSILTWAGIGDLLNSAQGSDLRCCYRSHPRLNSQTIKPFLKQGRRAIPINLRRSTDKTREGTGGPISTGPSIQLEAFSGHSSARLIGASGSWTILVQAARLVVPLPRRERREFRVGDSIRRAVESADSSALKKQRTLFGIWLSFTSGLKSNRAFLSRVLPDDPERHRPRRPVMGELSLGDVAVSFVRR
jgi:hypothetical protein